MTARVCTMVISICSLAGACMFSAACSGQPSPPQTTKNAPVAQSPTPPGSASQTAPQPAAAPAAAATPSPTGTPLASHPTNAAGLFADVVEFRRRGNVLTAQVRFRYQGAQSIPSLDFAMRDVYVTDEASGKKYEVLKDEKGNFIATNMGPANMVVFSAGESPIVWMKFPAPPPEVKTLVLQIPGVAPFEDLAIQDR